MNCQQLFKTIFETSPIGIKIVDTEGNFIDANAAYLNMLGVSSIDELQQINIFNCSEHGPEWKEKLLKFETVHTEYIVNFDELKKNKLLKSGRSGTAYFDGLISPITTENNRITNFIIHITDITDKKNAEIKAAKNAEQMALAIESANGGLWDWDLQNKKIYCSEKYHEITGYREDKSPETLEEFYAAIHPEDRPAALRKILDCLENRAAFFSSEYRILTKDHRFVWLLDRGKVVARQKDGKPSRIIGIVSDISERKTIEIELLKAKEKAEHSDMTKSQFLANMSHEIRTPMNAVIGFANLLLKTRLSEEQSEYLKIIEASSQNLLAIINDILDISKIQAGKFRLAHTEFNINEIVENTAKKLNVLADNKGLAINIFAEPIAPRLIGDPVRLEQVLTNLLSNAIKFTKAGSINVNLSKISETENSIQINISVQDTGIGIACDKLDKIFEYFEQLDTRDKKNYAGSGLGLGISKKMIEMMGGLIKVSSEEGHGSVFQFAINFSKAVVKKEHAFSRNVSKTPADHLSSAENQVKVLIAEDEFVNQRLIASLIQLRGWECRIAGNGLETLRMLGQEHFDIVLMDIQMPEMDGFETTHAIREMEKITGKKVIIIAVTAFAMRSDYERCMEAGMDDYISKPLQIDGFFDKLDTILARRGVQNTLITV